MWNDIYQRGMHAQLADWRRRLAAGERRVGWKMGYMDATVRDTLGLPHPLTGYLTSGRQAASGGALPCPRDAKLLAEAEVALCLGQEVPPDASVPEAASAVVAVAPAIEIVDVTETLNDIDKILAGNLYHAGVVLGASRDARKFGALTGVTGELSVNGLGSGTVDPTQLPADPGALVQLVARTLGRFGERLRAGDWIITGSVIKPCSVRPGDAVEVDLGALGRVTVRIEAG